MKWVTVKFLGIKVLCTLGRLYSEGTCLYCDYFHLGTYCIVFVLICTVVALYCFVMCGCVYVWACARARVCVCVCVCVCVYFCNVLAFW